jgi:hypothetical protein
VPSGGVAPYQFEWLSSVGADFVLRDRSPDELSEVARIESVSADGPATGGSMSIRVSDSSDPPRSTRFDLDLTLRRTCWFAYLSGDGAPELHLRDAFLLNDLAIAADTGGTVRDFQFSPNGDWLSFRVDAAGGSQLFAFRARPPRSLAAQRVSPECPPASPDAADGSECRVVDYAWSSDSNHLALLLRAASQDWLTGVSGFADGAGPDQPWPPQSSATWVADEVPLHYHEGLVWVGSEWLAFLGDELGSASPSLTSALYSATLNASGLGVAGLVAVPPMLTNAGTVLRPAAEGVVMIEAPAPEEPPLVSYYSAGGPARYHSGWLSPSSAWLASTNSAGELEVYDIRNDEAPIARSTDADAADPCQSVFSWSQPSGQPAVEHIACASGPDIAFFEFSPVEHSLRRRSRVAAVASAGARRAFSRDGRWFALGELGGTSWGLIDLNQSEPRIDPLRIHVAAPPVELLFPPFRDGLVTLAEPGGIAEYPLPGSTSIPSAFTSPGASPRSSCSESFWTAPDNWCGAPRASQHFAYADDGRSLLFEDGARRLSLGSPGVDPDARLVTDALVLCAEPCKSKAYAFQP